MKASDNPTCASCKRSGYGGVGCKLRPVEGKCEGHVQRPRHKREHGPMLMDFRWRATR